MTEPAYEVAIIGAGPGGIAAAHLLRTKGITNFVILERAARLRRHVARQPLPRPGRRHPRAVVSAVVRAQSRLEPAVRAGPRALPVLCKTPRGDWACTRICAPTPKSSDRNGTTTPGSGGCGFGIKPTVTARFVISSVGGYVNAKTAVDIDGIEDFEGTVLRPNAWDDDYDTRGKRIAVIGTGSSGVQIAAALSADAGQSLDVYQRTPAWVLPKIDFEFSPLMRAGLAAARLHRGRQRAGPAVDGRLHGGADRASAPPAARQGAGPHHAALRQVVPAAVPPAAARHGRRPRQPKGAGPPHTASSPSAPSSPARSSRR